VRKSGDGREVNRHNYTMAEIERAVGMRVVERLVGLIRLRNECPAFNGRFSVLAASPSLIELRWEYGKVFASLSLDLETYEAIVAQIDENGKKHWWKI
jgi:hypothetical protein